MEGSLDRIKGKSSGFTHGKPVMVMIVSVSEWTMTVTVTVIAHRSKAVLHKDEPDRDVRCK